MALIRFLNLATMWRLAFMACSDVKVGFMASSDVDIGLYGRGHQISTIFNPITARLVLILCKVNFLRLILDYGK